MRLPGLKDDHHSGMQVLCDSLGGRFYVADVGLLVGVERRRYADRDEIHIFDELEIGRRTEPALPDKSFEVGVYNIPDVVVAGVDHIDLFLLDIEADCPETGLGLLHGQG